MSKVLVTGGAGFIGSNLADALLAQGHEVHVWDNLCTGKEENIPKEAFFTRRNVSKPYLEGCEDEGFKVIYHLAALARIQPSFKDPLGTHDANTTGTQAILEVARANDAKVVYAGSSSFYHDPYANPYTFTKYIGEEYCKMYNKVYGLSVGIGRFFNVYGPRQLGEGAYATVIGIFENQKSEGKPLTITGTGEKRRDFTHVSDIVAGLMAIAEGEWNGEVFNFGTGRNHSINELADLFEPDSKHYLPNRPGEAQTTLADISFSREKLGYEPKVRLEDYVTEFVASLQSDSQVPDTE